MSENGMVRHTGDDAGLGLVEIVIAMMLLATLAVAFLPVLIQGLQLSATNATRATAGQLAHEQMEIARAQSDDCSMIQDLANLPVTPVTDPRNAKLLIDPVAGACPTSYPGTLSYSVTVVRENTGEVLTRADTLIFVAHG